MTLLTIPEACALLRISRRTLYREMAAGHLRSLHIGRKTLFTEREIAAYIAARVKAA